MELFQSRRLFLPAYWHLRDHYITLENDSKLGGYYYFKLKEEGLPSKEQFKQDILDKYKPYLETNYNIIKSFLEDKPL